VSEEEEGMPLTGTPAPPEQKWHAPHNPWLISGVATLATFMEILDTTIVIVALPHIAGNMGVGQDASTWVVTAYLLCNAVVIPFSPWMSALFGRKNFYLACVVLFTVSSLLCGLAPTFGLLVVFRLLQGLAGGGLLPATQAILVDTFPAHRRAMAMAMYSLVVVTAPTIGPTLGGWITDEFSWRWIFLINVPVGITSLFLASKFISDPPYLPRRRGRDRFKVDYIGFILIVIGLGGLQLTLSIGERKGWVESSTVVTMAIVSFLAIATAIVWEWRHKDPLVNLRLLKDRNLSASLALFFLFGIPFYGSMILYPLFLQGLLGYPAFWSGLAVSPGGLVMVCMMPVVGWLVSRMDPRKLASIGLIILGVALFYMSRFNLESDFKTIVLTRMLQSFGISLIFVPINTVAYTYVAAEARNNASSLISLARNTGAGISIALTANFLQRRSQVQQSNLVQHMTPYDPAYNGIFAQLQGWFMNVSGDPVTSTQQAHATMYGVLQDQSSALAFSNVYQILMIVSFCLVPITFLLRKPHKT
jgi:DHA2 family multidrug resistance protein